MRCRAAGRVRTSYGAAASAAERADQARYASKKDWGPLTKDLRLVYTATDATAAEAALGAFAERWQQRYPAIVKLWRAHWAQFIPFLAFPPELRRIIYTTDEIVKCSLLVGVVWFASAPRGPGGRVRPVRRRRPPRLGAACRCRPRQGSGGCHAVMGRRG
jgi:hypothetical protein